MLVDPAGTEHWSTGVASLRLSCRVAREEHHHAEKRIDHYLDLVNSVV